MFWNIRGSRLFFKLVYTRWQVQAAPQQMRRRTSLTCDELLTSPDLRSDIWLGLALCGAFGRSWEAIFAAFGPSWLHFGLAGGAWGDLGRRFGTRGGDFGTTLAPHRHPGGQLGRLWTNLGTIGGAFGDTLATFGSIWTTFGSPLASLWQLLAPFGPLLGTFCIKKRRANKNKKKNTKKGAQKVLPADFLCQKVTILAYFSRRGPLHF